MSADTDRPVRRGVRIVEPGVEIVFARELPTGAGGDLEALAPARVEVMDGRRSARWSERPIARLADATEPWPLLRLPHDLERAIDRARELGLGDGVPRVWMSAEAQSWLASRAPRSFALLMRCTALYQRDACWALVRDDEGVRLAWREAGEVSVHAYEAPLFTAAHAVARGALPGLGGAPPDALRLVRAWATAMWSTGRLGAELRWLGEGRGVTLRDGDGSTRLAEGARDGRDSVWLFTPASNQGRELDLRAPEGMEPAVVRLGLEWLLAGGTGRELFVDPGGRHVRELG